MILIKKFTQDSFVIFLVFSLSILSGCFESDNEEDIGEDFTFTLLDGSTKNLSDYRGKVVILDMWATWCSPCLAVMPELNKIYENYGRDDLEILSINIDSNEEISYIQDFKDWYTTSYGIELNWIFGNDDGTISEKYMNEGLIPTLVIFDQTGRLYYKHTGIVAYNALPNGFPAGTVLLAPVLDDLIE